MVITDDLFYIIMGQCDSLDIIEENIDKGKGGDLCKEIGGS